MNHNLSHGRLYIEGQHVGNIHIQTWKGAWGIGSFAALPAFDSFKSIFTEWSRLMHRDLCPISEDDANRLRELEYQMYALCCRLWLVESRRWRQVLILNIDGAMIEWKEGWAVDDTVTPTDAPETVQQPLVDAVAR